MHYRLRAQSWASGSGHARGSCLLGQLTAVTAVTGLFRNFNFCRRVICCTARSCRTPGIPGI